MDAVKKTNFFSQVFFKNELLLKFILWPMLIRDNAFFWFCVWYQNLVYFRLDLNILLLAHFEGQETERPFLHLMADSGLMRAFSLQSLCHKKMFVFLTAFKFFWRMGYLQSFLMAYVDWHNAFFFSCIWYQKLQTVYFTSIKTKSC